MNGVLVKESSEVVLISQIALQATALHLCGRFQELGIRAVIGLLPGVYGYQVIVPQVGLADVTAALKQFGMEIDGGP